MSDIYPMLWSKQENFQGQKYPKHSSMISTAAEASKISIENGCRPSVLKWAIWALGHFRRSLPLEAVLI